MGRSFWDDLAPLAPVAGGIIGGVYGGPAGAAAGASAEAYVSSIAGQQQTNQQNVDLANATSARNIEEAQRNRDFQERMSNTSHQREVADLKAAGINPLVSANGGAGTPSGSQGSAVNATVQNPYSQLTSLATTGLKAMQLVGNIDKQKADKNLVVAQTQALSGKIPKSEFTNDAYDLIRPVMKKIKQGVQSGSYNKRFNRAFFGNDGWEQRPIQNKQP